MRARLAKLSQDPFYRQNLVFFVGSMGAAVLNYLYHPVLSRLMSTEAFGETQALFSLFTQGSVILTVIGMVLMNIFTNRAEDGDARGLIAMLYSLSFFLMLALALGFAVFSPLLADSMQFRSAVPFLALSAVFLISVPFNFYKFYLQAHQRFSAISVLGMIAALGRVLAAALLVYLGASTFGAMMGLFVAIGLCLLYAKKKIGQYLRLPRLQKVRFWEPLRREGAYAALIFCGLLFVTLLYTADTLVVKYFFDPDIAGIYSGVATVARIIFFATGSISGVLLAHIKLSQTPLENHLIFMKGLVLTMCVGGSFFVTFALFPSFILSALLGPQYQALAPLLLPLSVLLCVVSLVHLFVSYFLALRRYALIPIALSGSLLASIFLLFFHKTPESIVYDFMIASVATLLAFVALYLYQREQPLVARATEPKKRRLRV